MQFSAVISDCAGHNKVNFSRLRYNQSRHCFSSLLFWIVQWSYEPCQSAPPGDLPLPTCCIPSFSSAQLEQMWWQGQPGARWCRGQRSCWHGGQSPGHLGLRHSSLGNAFPQPGASPALAQHLLSLPGERGPCAAPRHRGFVTRGILPAGAAGAGFGLRSSRSSLERSEPPLQAGRLGHAEPCWGNKQHHLFNWWETAAFRACSCFPWNRDLPQGRQTAQETTPHQNSQRTQNFC